MINVCNKVVLVAATCCLLVLLVSTGVSAHSSLSDYIVHERSLVVGEQYIDVTVSLTFMGDRAEAQRGKLDANGDGTVSKAERARYLDSITMVAEKQVRLTASGESIVLRPLYSSKVEQEEDYAPLTIHIYLFGRRPDSLIVGGEVELVESLYPRTPARFVHRVEGRDGVQARLSGDSGGIVKSLEEKTAPKLRATVIERESE
jgi:hypothetical protein